MYLHCLEKPIQHFLHFSAGILGMHTILLPRFFYFINCRKFLSFPASAERKLDSATWVIALSKTGTISFLFCTCFVCVCRVHDIKVRRLQSRRLSSSNVTKSMALKKKKFDFMVIWWLVSTTESWFLMTITLKVRAYKVTLGSLGAWA